MAEDETHLDDEAKGTWHLNERQQVWVNHVQKLAMSVGALQEFTELGVSSPEEAAKSLPPRLMEEWYARYFPVMAGRQGVSQFLDELGGDFDENLDAIRDEVHRELDVPPEDTTGGSKV